ncbi:homoserine kinase [Azospirillum thermophilum]|uniref:Homoserine kinase n=1 Tax=Azospirillum thermophilum TaxID=2202148 RepID=A0A2S2CLU7_9PROT|nr:homoserine kinase [Azospirillum thermophilum]AWK85451.1 homoserine kinase [Azospirillum thermophilum]
MAVYTEVSDEDLNAFVAQYDLGAVVSCKGIAEGVENSNFLLVTDRGPYILTLYEKRTRREDLPFFLGLMEHLAAKGIACPLPVAGRDGQALRELCGRPAVIVTFLAGMWPRRILPQHCAQLGTALARLHLAVADFTMRRPNALSLGGWKELYGKCAARADEVAPGLRETLETELAALEAHWPAGLPSGVIHADLFPDNVFFRGEELSGLIDFYFACNDFLVYDVAICINAWCFEIDGSFNATKARLLLASYRKVRPLSRAELVSLPWLCRGSAVRFLLTRLYDWLNHPPGAFVRPKDPLEYLRKLRFHQTVRGLGDYFLDEDTPSPAGS